MPLSGFSNQSLSMTPTPYLLPSQPPRHQRVLACTYCQQRKTKCDRKFPCGNCVKARVHCVQATLARRRRRFSERTLLDRIRKYEDLLRQNKIPFEPLHAARGEDSSNVGASDDSDNERTQGIAPKTPDSRNHQNSENSYGARCV